MKRSFVFLVVCVTFLAASAPHAKREASRTLAPELAQPNTDPQVVRGAAENLASVVNALQAARARDGSGADQSVGNLWIEVNRLKRGGQNVRAIEWYVSDLEGSMRSGQQGAVARRHILNNLDYEIETLKRRQR